MKKTAILLIALSTGLVPAPDVTGQSGPPPVKAAQLRDAQRVRVGIFLYRDMDHGKEVGSSTITIRRLVDSGNYEYSADSTFSVAFHGFRSQRWKAVASPEFVPLSATLAFVRDNEVVPVFDIRYGGDHVTGHLTERKEHNSSSQKTVDASVPPNTVDQRIDWAVVLGGTLETGQQFEFNVYDPTTGVSKISGQVGPLEAVQVPAGNYRAFRIVYQMQKLDKTEHFQMLASQDYPHIMLREEFPNGVIAELIQFKELSGQR